MSKRYVAYPDLNDPAFLKWVVDHFAKLRGLKDDVLSNLIIKRGAEPDLHDIRVITKSIMHVPLVYLYERYLYEKAKPEADRIAGQISQKL